VLLNCCIKHSFLLFFVLQESKNFIRKVQSNQNREIEEWANLKSTITTEKRKKKESKTKNNQDDDNQLYEDKFHKKVSRNFQCSHREIVVDLNLRKNLKMLSKERYQCIKLYEKKANIFKNQQEIIVNKHIK
jgi:hypothetical protein